MSTSASPFAAVEMAPRDPILGLNEQFNADPNPAKVNLGVGVYFDDQGKLPVLRCVATAEKQLLEAPKAKGYLPIDGIAAYDKAVQGLVFGDDSPVVTEGRVATVQALGGTGGLKVGADFLKRLNPAATVLDQRPELGEPPRAVHQRRLRGRQLPLLRRRHTRRALRRHAGRAERGRPRHHRRAARLLPQPDRLRPVAGTVGAGGAGRQGRDLVAFLDMAYQGFGEGIAEDGAVIGQFLASGVRFFVSTSFSKSFSLYGERVGALSVVCGDKDEATRVLSQLKIVIRTNYSNPPTFGAHVVATVLTTPALRALWEEELAGMRERIRATRHSLVAKLQAAGVQGDLSYITRQKGMFSYSGLAKEQMQRLRSEFGVYGVDSGRICVAAINSRNIDGVVAALAQVM